MQQLHYCLDYWQKIDQRRKTMKDIKEKYVSPAVEIITLKTKDIITISTPDDTESMQ